MSDCVCRDCYDYFCISIDDENEAQKAIEDMEENECPNCECYEEE
jgi:hypothetical protein